MTRISIPQLPTSTSGGASDSRFKAGTRIRIPSVGTSNTQQYSPPSRGIYIPPSAPDADSGTATEEPKEDIPFLERPTVKVLMKGLEGLGAPLTGAGQAVQGFVASDEIFSVEGVRNAMKAFSRPFASALNLDELIINNLSQEGVVSEALKNNIRLYVAGKPLPDPDRSTAETIVEALNPEIAVAKHREKIGVRQMSDAQKIALGATAALTTAADFVLPVGAVRLSKGPSTLGAVGQSIKKAAPVVGEALRDVKTVAKDSIVTVGEGLNHAFRLMRGGKEIKGVDRIAKFNTETLMEMRLLNQARNVQLGKHRLAVEKFNALKSGHSEAISGIDDAVVAAEKKAKIDAESASLMKQIIDSEKHLKQLEAQTLSKLGIDSDKLNEMLDLVDEYNIVSRKAGKETREVLSEADRAKRVLQKESELASKRIREAADMAPEEAKQAFQAETGFSMDRVNTANEVFDDLQKFATGEKRYEDLSLVTQKILKRKAHKGGKATIEDTLNGFRNRAKYKKVTIKTPEEIGRKGEAALFGVDKKYPTVTYTRDSEELIGFLRDTIKKVTGLREDQIKALGARIQTIGQSTMSLARRADEDIIALIAKANDQIGLVGEEAARRVALLKGGPQKLKELSYERYGRDITQLSKAELKDLATVSNSEVDKVLSELSLIKAEERMANEGLWSRLSGLEASGSKLRGMDREAMTAAIKERNALAADLEAAGRSYQQIHKLVSRLNEEFASKFGMHPKQFEQLESFAADLDRVPFVMRFSGEHLDNLDRFRTMAGGVTHRMFMRALSGKKSLTPAWAQPMVSKMVEYAKPLNQMRQHLDRLVALGPEGVEIAGRIIKRIQYQSRLSARWKETILAATKGFSQSERAALKVAMENDGSREQMLQALSGFSSIRTPDVIDAATSIRKTMNEIIALAKEEGVDVSEYLSNYFPRIKHWRRFIEDAKFRDAFLDRITHPKTDDDKQLRFLEMSNEEFDFLSSAPAPTASVEELMAWQDEYYDIVREVAKREKAVAKHKNAGKDITKGLEGADGRAMASRILNNIAYAKSNRASKNLVSRRLYKDDPFPDVEDPIETLEIYVDRAARTIADQAYLTGKGNAKQDQDVLNLISNIASRDSDAANAARRLFYDSIGVPRMGDRAGYRTAAFLRAWQTPKLAYMAVNNAFQGVLGTALQTDLMTALKAVKASFKTEGELRKWALRSGAITRNAELELAEGMGIDKLARTGWTQSMQEKFLKWNGAAWTETQNRITNSIGAKLYLEKIRADILSKGIKNVNELPIKYYNFLKDNFTKPSDFIEGVLGKYGDKEWDEVLTNTAQWATKQGQTDPTGIFGREFLQSPFGSVWLQFKSFPLNQAKQMTRLLNPRRVINEIFLDTNLSQKDKAKAFANFVTTALAYQVSGEIIGDVRTAIINSFREKDKERPSFKKDLAERMFQNFMYVGGLGLLSDIYNSFGDRFKAEGLLLGPTGGDVLNALTAKNLASVSSTAIEKVPIPILNKALADIVQGK